RSFLMSSALAWLDRYHVDGLRVDAVASMLYLDYSREEGEWLPNRHGGRENLEAISLLQQTNEAVHALHPGAIMIAEESTAFPRVTGAVSEGGLGFDFKWNMGWMHDVLQYFRASPAERPSLSRKLTFARSYQFTENFVQVFSHDEVVHGKSPMIFKMGVAGEGGLSEQAAHLRALYVYMWAWPGKKTLFMGNEFGQTTEWNFDASLDWDLLQHEDHAGLSALVKDLNHLYLSNEFLGANDLNSDKFRWVECGQRSPALFSFFRFGNTPQETLLAVFNLSDSPVQGHRVGVPFGGAWQMILQSQDKAYGYSLDACSDPGAHSEQVPAGEWEHSLALDLPAPSAVLLMPGLRGAGRIK
ncbi:MAG: alpha amylase C-terminal domain-containing protein, partial [Opitutales bacterium]